MGRPLWHTLLLFTLTAHASAQGTGSSPEETELRAFPLVHIRATDAEPIVRDLVGRPRPARPAARGTLVASGPRLIVDRRTNNLLVCAGREEMHLIAEIVKMIDVSRPGQPADQRPATCEEPQELDETPAGAARLESEGVEQDSAGNRDEPRHEQHRTESAPRRQSEVRITTDGTRIIMVSDDLQALDRVERLIEAIIAAAPQRTRWTVCYLRSAVATETAVMLGQLFPEASISGSAEPADTSFPILSPDFLFGAAGDAMEASDRKSLKGEGVLRIVPEIRSNALFISGSAVQVSRVIEALGVLDAGALPESLKDRLPRLLQFEHAHVNDVAAIIRDVFAGELSGSSGPAALPVRGEPHQLNPAATVPAALPRGGRRGAQLTIGLDLRTNSLVINASESLFRQVAAVAAAIDESARDARRTVQFVSPKGAKSSIGRQRLASLLGKAPLNRRLTD